MPLIAYDNDWEEPRLAIEGFVSSYFQVRLMQDGVEWYDAPDVPNGAENEHEAMRNMCSEFEKQSGEALRSMADELLADSHLTFAKYCEVVDEFGRVDTDLPNEMTYGRMVGLMTFAGLLALEKARQNSRRDVSLIALYTGKFIEKRIQMTWSDARRSWAGFMNMAHNVASRVAQRASRRTTINGAPAVPPVPNANHQAANPPSASPPESAPAPSKKKERRSSILMFLPIVAVAAIGAVYATRSAAAR